MTNPLFELKDTQMIVTIIIRVLQFLYPFFMKYVMKQKPAWTELDNTDYPFFTRLLITMMLNDKSVNQANALTP